VERRAAQTVPDDADPDHGRIIALFRSSHVSGA
jgi:hypothetical protein